MTVLDYGRPANRKWRRRLAIALIVAAASASMWFAWPRAAAWYTERAAVAMAARRAAESMAWYSRAAAWREPSDRLKFSTADADVEPHRSATHRPRSLAFGHSDYQGIAFDGPNPRAYMTADTGGLFTHARTDRFGVTQLICIDQATLVDDVSLQVHVTRYDRLPDGRAVRVLIEYAVIDLRPLGDGRELRVFAGQPDPDDPSRFTIPFESHGRPGAIGGFFESAAIVSPNPGVLSRERTGRTGVRLTPRLPATTVPANR